MLNDRALDRMSEDGLREYVRVLHETLTHIFGSVGAAHSHLQQSSTSAPKANGHADGPNGTKPKAYLEKLARALSGGAIQ